MSKERYVYVDDHILFKRIVAVRTEERRFRFHKPHRVRKRTNEIFQITALVVKLSAHFVDFSARVADFKHTLRKLHNFNHIDKAFSLLGGVFTAYGNGVTERTCIAVDTGSDTKHYHFAVFHYLIRCCRHNRIGTDTAADNRSIRKAIRTVFTANRFACRRNLVFLIACLHLCRHGFVRLASKLRRLTSLFHFPITLYVAEFKVVFRQVYNFATLKTCNQILMYRIRHIRRTDKTNLLYGEFLGKLCEQIAKANDGCQGIFFIGNHEYGETTHVGDCRVLLCEGFAFRTAQKHRRAVAANQNRALFKLSAPTGQIPTVRHVQFVEVNDCNIRILLVEKFYNLRNSVFRFLFVVISHIYTPIFIFFFY